jgi:phosphodiesterase/alkaline phosphatase D-like protein
VNYHFEYGTTTAYGLIAPVPDAFTPITSETLALSQPVSGLQAGTTYHYRLVASSPGGTEVKGPDETFTTLSIPAPAVATGASEGVGVGSATLTGTVDPHGWDTTYLFQYGTSTTYGSSWPSIEVDMGALEGAQPVVVSVPNLLPDTTYHYRLIATSGGGTSYGPDVTFTTTEYPASIIQEAPLVSLPKVTTTTITKTKSETKAQKLAKALKACGKDKNKGKREVCERAAHKDFGTKQKGKAKKK